MKNKILIMSCCILIVVIAIFFGFHKGENIVDAQASADVVDIVKEELNENNNDNEDSLVKVDIKGAIRNPGVYEVNSSKRVVDVIQLAGGLNKNANTNYINLSSKVKDEMVIWIYTVSEIEEFKLKQSSTEYMIESCNCPVVDNTACLSSTSENDKDNSNSNGVVNINSATIEELMTLNGVGEAKAKSIIEYRNTNGKFNSIQDIMNVSGIGEALYNKIKDNIEV